MIQRECRGLFLDNLTDEIAGQIFLVFEVLVETALGNARTLDDSGDGDIAVVVVGKFVDDHIHDALTFVVRKIEEGLFWHQSSLAFVPMAC